MRPRPDSNPVTDETRPCAARLSAGLRVLLVALLLSQAGCLWAAVGATAAGAAGYAYWQGKDCHAYVADMGDAMKATKTALTELGMTVSSEVPGDATTTIKTRAADGAKVTIKLHQEKSQIPSEGTLTEICVRVGAFGDHPLSGRILYQISAHLVPAVPPGAAAPPGTPTVGPGPLPPPGPGVAPPPIARGVPTEPPLAPPGPPAPPPGPITPASWAPVKTGEPPLSK